MRKSPEAPHPAELLGTFSQFIAAAQRLEASHQTLQAEVIRLRSELEDRNKALELSVVSAENAHLALHKVLDALPCGVVLVSDDGARSLLDNPEARRILGYEDLGSNTLPDAVQKICANSRCAETDDSEIVVKRGSEEQWLAIRSTGVWFSPESRAGSQRLLIIRDVTAQKKFERERERLRHSVALGEMASVLAHEIRNPLGSMELFLSLLGRESSLSAEGKNWVDHLSAGVRGLTCTVNSVLQFYTSGTLQLGEMRVGSLLQECLSFLAPVASERQISMLLKTRDNPLILGDANGLKQVVLNLCQNSLRHTLPGGMVGVSSERRGNVVRIEILDSGSGIAPEHLAHVFEVGFSATGRTSGLGLAVCKQIAEAHSGTVGVASTGDTGTTMYVEIPAL